MAYSSTFLMQIAHNSRIQNLKMEQISLLF